MLFFSGWFDQACILAYQIFSAGIAAILLCFHLNAHAGAPDYLGPWSYQTSSTDWVVKRFSSEEEAFSYAFDGYNKSAQYPICSYFWWDAPSDWTRTYGEGSVDTHQARSRALGAYVNSNGVCVKSDVGHGAIRVDRSRIFCSETMGIRYFAQAKECRSGGYYPKKGKKGGNVGPQCPSCDTGEPITPATGNMWHSITDYASSKIVKQLESPTHLQQLYELV